MAHIMDDKDDSFPLLGSVYKKAPGFQVNIQSNRNVATLGLNSAQQGKVALKAWGSQKPAAWACPNSIQKLGIESNGNVWTTQNAKNLPSNGNALSSQQINYAQKGQESQADDSVSNQDSGTDDDGDDDDIVAYASEDDDLFDYDSDSDAIPMSHEALKKTKWFKAFFNDLDTLTVEQLNSAAWNWHCPACKGGPGAIDWYRGIEPLVYHARTKKARRAKLHQVFAELLEEEMHKRGTLVTPSVEPSGRWEGLDEKVKDYEIIWPPMVAIMNTRYEQEENGKWIGMGNQELLDYFSSYAALKARHSYGPNGHRGLSLLIFESSAAGYLEASRLHKHFMDQGRGREAWNCNRVLFCAGGKRQLYGYMALKEDLDLFTQHCQGRNKLKFEMVSYQERVGSCIKQINEDSQELVSYKNRFAKEHMHSQALAESFSRLSEKLKKTVEENRIVREQTKLLHEQIKEEMDSQEEFFKDQIKIIRQAVDAKEDDFEKLLQEKLDKAKQLNANPSSAENAFRAEDIDRFIKLQDKDMEEFKKKREKLMKRHDSKKAEIAKRYWEEQLELEKEFENELTQLIEKHTPDHTLV